MLAVRLPQNRTHNDGCSLSHISICNTIELFVGLTTFLTIYCSSRDNDSGGGMKLQIFNVAPYTLNTEFDQILGNLLVKFNANIQLTQPCVKIFGESSMKVFDT